MLLRFYVDTCFFIFVANIPLKLEQLMSKDYVGSELDGNPPIWITKKSMEEIYVNQAKIIFHLANYEHANLNNQPQVIISYNNYALKDIYCNCFFL